MNQLLDHFTMIIEKTIQLQNKRENVIHESRFLFRKKSFYFWTIFDILNTVGGVKMEKGKSCTIGCKIPKTNKRIAICPGKVAWVFVILFFLYQIIAYA